MLIFISCKRRGEERKKGREGEFDVKSTVQMPKSYNRQDWARSKPGAMDYIWVSQVVGRNPCRLGYIVTGNWNWEQPGTHTRQSSVEGRCS